MKPEPTFEEKLAAMDTLTELEGVKYGLQIEAQVHGHEVDQGKMAALARRRAEIQKERGAA